jgi:hypothetical protein
MQESKYGPYYKLLSTGKTLRLAWSRADGAKSSPMRIRRFVSPPDLRENNLALFGRLQADLDARLVLIRLRAAPLRRMISL